MLVVVREACDPDTTSPYAHLWLLANDSTWRRASKDGGYPRLLARGLAQWLSSSVTGGMSLELFKPCFLLSTKIEEMVLFTRECVCTQSSVTERVNFGFV